MVILLRGFIAVIAFCGMLSSVAAAATEAERRKELLPTIRSATDCIASSVSRLPSLPSPLDLTSIEAPIRVVLDGGSCQNELNRIIRRHDQLYGAQTGPAFVDGPYMRDLPRALLDRVSRKFTGNITAPTTSGVGNAARIEVTDGRTAASQSPATRRDQSSALPASSTTANSVKTVSQFTGEHFSLFLVALGTSVAVLLMLGLGSRFVVFVDEDDLLMTACILFVPIITALAMLAIGFVLSVGGASMNLPVWDYLKAHPAFLITLGIGALCWAWAILGTLVSSIRHNGLVFGIVIASMKVMAGIAMGLAWFGSLHLFAGEDRSNSLLRLLFLGILIWFASKLINGHRVMERREYRMQMLASD